jgi:Transcriptional regulator
MPRAVPGKSAMPPRRRTRDAERTQAAILIAAKEVFLRGDYHQASLSDIAQRAGVTQSLIHHHFGSKKGLYVCAMRALLAELDEDLKGIVQPSIESPESAAADGAAADGPAFIASAVRGYFRFLAANEQCVRLYRILDLSLHSDPDLLAGLVELDDQGREMNSLHLIRAALERLTLMKQRGELRADVEPLPLLTVILCAVEHWFTSSRRLNHRLGQAMGAPGASGMSGAPGTSGVVAGEDFLRTFTDMVVRGALAGAKA